MSFAGKVWRLLVGIKDGLVLLFMLLFFITLFSVLSSRPSPGVVREGALLIALDGTVVEEASEFDPLDVLLSQRLPTTEYPVRNIVRALDAAATDERIKAVVLDLSRFLGGGHVHVQEIAAAIDRVRAAEKPVLTFAVAYGDDAVMLAAHASEAWVDPIGGAAILGPGGNRQYYKRLFDEFGVNAHIYRVGEFKSAVEPYMLTGMSPEARENTEALYAVVWEEYKASIKKARPQVDIEAITRDPVGWLGASGGDTAAAAKAAGLVDVIGDRVAFGERVAELVGEDRFDSNPGNFVHTELGPWLAANRPDSGGKAIGVVTIAGEITDGDEGPGIAGGERIRELLDDALDDDLAALVIRVDSPGGTLTGSEEIRRAIMRHKDKGIPIAVSMANYAASGGYWVSTPADRIFAEPESVTGSIGIFGVLPSFERTLARFGVDSDGVRTTPLSGQPDLLGGLTPEVDQFLQATIEHEYRVFLDVVGQSRGKSADEVDTIGQGRVWDGGTARQLGLVDQFGNLDNAIEWAAREAGLEAGDWHARFIGSRPSQYDSLIRALLIGGENREAAAPRDLFALVGAQHRDVTAQVARDLERLLGAKGAQAYCLECAPLPAASERQAELGFFARLVRLLLD
ncbi:MAG TPA: signal peptide peptidase SppA [Sphingomonadaceae bacterium]|nr:signal peptide peptidase SppA [Sphingomonadaceae bacterium]